MPPGARPGGMLVVSFLARSAVTGPPLWNFNAAGARRVGIGTHFSDHRIHLLGRGIFEEPFHALMQRGLLVAPFVTGRLAHAASPRRAAVIFLSMTSSCKGDRMHQGRASLRTMPHI